MTDKCFSHSNYKTYSYDLTINTDTFPVHLFLQIKFLEESIMELEGMKVFIKKKFKRNSQIFVYILRIIFHESASVFKIYLFFFTVEFSRISLNAYFFIVKLQTIFLDTFNIEYHFNVFVKLLSCFDLEFHL